ncbi:MAG: hypothetical protein KC586_10450, partial [Myxococcales bacterium]|nr:hypothetical protein [Myxococcales bacterium]
VRERPPLSIRREGDVAIVRFENSLGRSETVAAFDEAIVSVADAPALVIDLRNTPSGGNTDVARAILGHFVDDSTPYQRHEIPAVERATTVPRRFVEHVLPRAPRFRGRVVVLGGRWTGSMGEGLVVGFDAIGAHTVASDMGDLLGAMTQIPLEACEGVLELGVESLFHVDGTPRADYVADVPLESSDRDTRGDDPALTAALAWLRDAL